MDYFKPNFNRSLGKHYILPASNLFRVLPGDKRDSVFEEIWNCYNFSLPDLLRYMILKYDATIEPLEKYPYFSFYFKKSVNALDFCDELNIRYKFYLRYERNNE